MRLPEPRSFATDSAEHTDDRWSYDKEILMEAQIIKGERAVELVSRTDDLAFARAAGSSLNRRPCKARANPVLVAVAARLARARTRPNLISVAGICSSVACAGCLVMAPRAGAAAGAVLLITAATLIASRGLCNLLDGMVAIEGGMSTPTGAVFNELPERISDVIVLIAAGYSVTPAWGYEAGWSAAVLALLTAYVRVLGGALGLKQDFSGPMAKPQRGIVLIAACLLAAVQMAIEGSEAVLAVSLVFIAAGSAATVYRRARRLCAELGSL
jgi:phosphatidylglycerophosphate synthase